PFQISSQLSVVLANKQIKRHAIHQHQPLFYSQLQFGTLGNFPPGLLHSTRKSIETTAVNHIEQAWVFVNLDDRKFVGFQNLCVGPSVPLPKGNSAQVFKSLHSVKLGLVIRMNNKDSMAQQTLVERNTHRQQLVFHLLISR